MNRLGLRFMRTYCCAIDFLLKFLPAAELTKLSALREFLSTMGVANFWLCNISVPLCILWETSSRLEFRAEFGNEGLRWSGLMLNCGTIWLLEVWPRALIRLFWDGLPGVYMIMLPARPFDIMLPALLPVSESFIASISCR